MIRCFTYRQLLRRCLDSGRVPGRHLDRHMDGCRSCREHYEQLLDLDEQLRLSKPEPVQASPGLTARIMAQIEREPAQTGMAPAAAASSGWHVNWAGAGLVAAVLILGFASLPDWAPSGDGGGPFIAGTPEADSSSKETDVMADLIRLPGWESAPAWETWSGQLENPLEAEMKLVANDARQMMQVLAGHFLPDSINLGGERAMVD